MGPTADHRLKEERAIRARQAGLDVDDQHGKAEYPNDEAGRTDDLPPVESM